MLELIENAVSAPNFFLTALLCLVLLYWLSVIVGALDIKSFDSDLHLDKGLGVPDKGVEVPGKDVHVGGGGLFLGLLRFFNFGQLPFMVVISILILTAWALSMMINHPGSLLNPLNAYWLACVYSLPILFVSLFITKLLTQPLIPLFKRLDSTEAPIDFTGKMGQLTVPASASQVGQVRIMVNNSDVLLRVKTADGSELQKGDKVLIIEALSDENCFLVQKIQE